jgi:hypothetical protein
LQIVPAGNVEPPSPPPLLLPELLPLLLPELLPELLPLLLPELPPLLLPELPPELLPLLLLLPELPPELPPPLLPPPPPSGDDAVFGVEALLHANASGGRARNDARIEALERFMGSPFVMSDQFDLPGHPTFAWRARIRKRASADDVRLALGGNVRPEWTARVEDAGASLHFPT